MKQFSNEGRLLSTRKILPEDKQGMSLEQSDFISISLQEIGAEPEPLQEEPAVQVMPNIVSHRDKKFNKNQQHIKEEKIIQKNQENKQDKPKHSKANPNAGSVAHRVLDKWGIDRKTAAAMTAAGYAPFDAQKNMPKNIRSGRQKKQDTQAAEKALQQTFQAPYQPIQPKPVVPEKPKKAAKNNKKSKTKAKKGSASQAVESLKWAVENSPAKQQRRISADIQSADKAVAKLFRSQRQMPPLKPMGDDELPLTEQPHHTISAAELKAALLPNQEEISRNKGLKAVKLPKGKSKIKLPERKNKASAVQAVEALRWAVEHNPDKPKRRQPEKTMPPLQPMSEDELPLTQQTHHPISAAELQAMAIDEERRN